MVIIATTRCNKGQYIGFLKSEERMNVAVTRAKRLCVFVGSVATLIKNEESFIKEFYEFTSSHGEVLRFDKFKQTFKKVKTFTQMSKPAASGQKSSVQPAIASASTASEWRVKSSISSQQQQPQKPRPAAARDTESSDLQWRPVQQPATSGSVHSTADGQQHSRAHGPADWAVPTRAEWAQHRTQQATVSQSNRQIAPRTGGSLSSTSSHRAEAPGIYPAPWGSSLPSHNNNYPYQIHEPLYTPSSSSHHPKSTQAEAPSKQRAQAAANSKFAGGTAGPRSTLAPVKKGPIQLAANPYAGCTADWTPSAETGWDWHYDGRAVSTLPAA